MKIEYKFNSPWSFSFSLPCPKNFAFERETTTEDGVVMAPIALSEGSSTTYHYPLSSVRTISRILGKLGIEVDFKELFQKVGKPIFEDIGQQYLYPEQYEYMKQVMKYWSGCIGTPTGSGKGTMITYLCQASLIRNKKIVICAPTYSIVEELKMRLDKYNIKSSSEFEEDCRVWVVNPAGLMARHKKDEYKSWLEDVDMVIVDESDAITDSLERFIVEFLPNCKYFYGFSATLEKRKGLDFTGIDSFKNILSTAARILIYIGLGIVYKPPTKKIRVVITPLQTGDYQNYWSYARCVIKITKSTYFPLYLRMCIRDNNKIKRSPILFPYTDIKQIEHLMTNEILKPYTIAIWSASGIRYNNRPEEKGVGLERVKEICDSDNCDIDVLCCTSVGFKGVDIVSLKSVLFITGSSYGIITQILGRIFRYKGTEPLTVYLPENISVNPLWNAAYEKRKECILKNDHIIEHRPLERL